MRRSRGSLAGDVGAVRLDHAQPFQQQLDRFIRHGVQGQRGGQTRPVQPAHACGKQVPDIEGKAGVVIVLRLVVGAALLLDAGRPCGLRVQQGRQFPW
jgi:hypothetical protein